MGEPRHDFFFLPVRALAPLTQAITTLDPVINPLMQQSLLLLRHPIWGSHHDAVGRLVELH